MKFSFWDFLSLLVLLGICLLATAMTQIFLDPSTPLNPFPPPTLPAVLQLPTATFTARPMPTTWTPAAYNPAGANLKPSSTPLPPATVYALPSETPTQTATVTPTATYTPTNTRTITNTPRPSDTSLPTHTPKPTRDYALTELVKFATRLAATATRAAQLTATCESYPEQPCP